MEQNEAIPVGQAEVQAVVVVDANVQPMRPARPAFSPIAGALSTCALTFFFVSVWLFFNIFCVVFVYKIAKATEKIADKIEKLTLSEKKI
jgi:hypothetical protein